MPRRIVCVMLGDLVLKELAGHIVHGIQLEVRHKHTENASTPRIGAPFFRSSFFSNIINSA